MRYITISSQLRVPRVVPVSLSPTDLARNRDLPRTCKLRTISTGHFLRLSLLVTHGPSTKEQTTLWISQNYSLPSCLVRRSFTMRTDSMASSSLVACQLSRIILDQTSPCILVSPVREEDADRSLAWDTIRLHIVLDGVLQLIDPKKIKNYYRLANGKTSFPFREQLR